MSDKPINYANIDPGIRDIVYALNERIPFTTTGPEGFGGSCEGHLEDKLEITGLVPEPGHKFIHHGHIIFGIDTTHPKAVPLLQDLNILSKRYDFAYFQSHACGNVECLIEGWRSLDLYTGDITREMEISDDDPDEVAIRKRHQVRENLGQNRIEKFQQVWKEVMEVLEKYSV